MHSTDSCETAGTTVLGYPRQGRNRELKRAIEAFWSGGLSRPELLDAVSDVRRERLRAMSVLDEVPVGDFSLYDHVLDTAWMFGAVPVRFSTITDSGDDLDGYFAMARGTSAVAPLEMTKWFDTNYHYLVPELNESARWGLHPDRLIEQIDEALALGLAPRPVILGPVTFLMLAKTTAPESAGFHPLDLLGGLLPRYTELLTLLADRGIEWVQLDEPILATDVHARTMEAVEWAYRVFAEAPERPRILLANYFGDLGEHTDRVLGLPVDGFSLDLAATTASHLDRLGQVDLAGKRLLAGVVEGRNVWRADLAASIATVKRLRQTGAELTVSTSCSLLHVPIDVAREPDLDEDVKSWLAFADQKIAEVVLIADALNGRGATVEPKIEAASQALAARSRSPITHNAAVRDRAARVTAADLRRCSAYADRRRAQQDRLGLPSLPTTTIGSFPQTREIRRDRADYAKGRIDEATYVAAMRAEIDGVVQAQVDLDLDVIVHGEAERNDMVQYFATQLSGVLSTEHGWVQSYGTRCVRPPIIVGDVQRPGPMTVSWSRYAQGRTSRPVKGMLTGPVTMLAWSFVRDDQPLAETARQMALALRDEVLELEAAGIGIIQVDEPALRETLPLRQAEQAGYLDWAVGAFQLTTAQVADATQIHTHMCYAEFGDITEAIEQLDADVISLEAARSRMEVIGDLVRLGYPREVGPGVWDIHSPRVPAVDEIVEHLRHAVARLPADRLWVNPDCGLKTRGWAEVSESLQNMVTATRAVRAELAG